MKQDKFLKKESHLFSLFIPLFWDYWWIYIVNGYEFNGTPLNNPPFSFSPGFWKYDWS